MPVYLGPPNVAEFLPDPEAIIDYGKLGSPEALMAVRVFVCTNESTVGATKQGLKAGQGTRCCTVVFWRRDGVGGTAWSAHGSEVGRREGKTDRARLFLSATQQHGRRGV